MIKSKPKKRKKNPKLNINDKKFNYFWKLWYLEVDKILKNKSWINNNDVPINKEAFLTAVYNNGPIYGFTKIEKIRGEEKEVPLLTHSTLLAWQERIISIGQLARLSFDDIDLLIEYLTNSPYKY